MPTTAKIIEKGGTEERNTLEMKSASSLYASGRQGLSCSLSLLSPQSEHYLVNNKACLQFAN